MNVWSRFLSAFTDGILKPNKYEVIFRLPAGVSTSTREKWQNPFGTSNALRSVEKLIGNSGSINIKCHTAMFPQRTLQSFDVKQNQAPFRAPFSASYDPVTFSFYADANVDTRDFFELWQNAAYNSSSNTMNFYKEYVSNIDMYTLDDAGRRRYGVTLFEAWPVSIGPMDVSYSQVDNFQNVMATFAYKRWERIQVAGSSNLFSSLTDLLS